MTESLQETPCLGRRRSVLAARTVESGAAGRIGRERCRILATHIRATLQESIAAGGSSVRDYVHSDGGAGSFQVTCFVYGREGQPCRVCGTPIRASRQAGRTTFNCPRCQR